jgi:effector-binding domain-containing protein
MTTGPIETTELPDTPVAVVRGHVGRARIGDFLTAAYTDTMRLLTEQHRPPTGPPFARFTDTGDGFDVEAGFPVPAAIEGSGQVVAGVLPGGPAATALHHGPYETVGETYEAVEAWLAAHGYRRSGQAWESYLDEPGVPEPRTLVTFPCARAS